MGRKKKSEIGDAKPTAITYMENRYKNGVKQKWIDPYVGARLFSMSKPQFMRMAKRAKANFIISRTSVINLEILEKYLEEDKYEED